MASLTVAFGVLMVLNLMLLFIFYYSMTGYRNNKREMVPLSDVFAGQGDVDDNDGNYDDYVYNSDIVPGERHNGDLYEEASSINNEEAVVRNENSLIKIESLSTKTEPSLIAGEGSSVDNEAVPTTKIQSAMQRKVESGVSGERGEGEILTEASWEKNMEERFTGRLERVKATCQKYESVDSVQKTIDNHIFYVDNYGFLACAVPKVSAFMQLYLYHL